MCSKNRRLGESGKNLMIEKDIFILELKETVKKRFLDRVRFDFLQKEQRF